MAMPHQDHAPLIDAVLNLYTGSRDDVAYTMANWYAEDASFKDPIVHVIGRSAAEQQFVIVKGLFVSASIQNLEMMTPIEESVIVHLQVEGLDYQRLIADAALKSNFEALVKASVGTAAGLNHGSIDVELGPGILVKATVPLAAGSTLGKLKSSLEESRDAISGSMLQGLLQLPGAGQIQTGKYQVDVLGVAEDEEAARTRVVFSYLVLYRPSRLLADKAVPIRQTTHLRVSKEGLVEEHIDEWHNPLNRLSQLPGPFGFAYNLWRRVLGHATSAASRRAAALFDTVRYPASGALSLADKACSMITGVELSPVSILEGLVDLRGLSTFHAAPKSFEGITAMFVGDLDEVSLRVASHMVQDGAATLHVVSTPGPDLNSAAEFLSEQNSECKVTPHGIDFGHPRGIDQWCTHIRHIAEDENPIDLLVLGTFPAAEVGVGPNGEEQVCRSDLTVLQTLIGGLEPALAGRGRVVVVASAASQWLPEEAAARAVALSRGTSSETVFRGAGPVQAGAIEQAARVQLAAKQGQTWSKDCEGLDCVSCTPGGVWANWSDALAISAQLPPVRLATTVLSYVPGWRMLLGAAQSVAAAQAQRSLLQLCTKEEYVSPGAYYWGQHRVAPGTEQAQARSADARDPTRSGALDGTASYPVL